MGQLLVRELDETLIDLLQQRASRNGRSAEAEHRAILQTALLPTREALVQQSRRFREETAGRGGPDSADILRSMRDQGLGEGA